MIVIGVVQNINLVSQFPVVIAMLIESRFSGHSWCNSAIDIHYSKIKHHVNGRHSLLGLPVSLRNGGKAKRW